MSTSTVASESSDMTAMSAEPDEAKYESLYEIKSKADGKAFVSGACCPSSFDDEIDDDGGHGYKTATDALEDRASKNYDQEIQKILQNADDIMREEVIERICEKEVQEYIQQEQQKEYIAEEEIPPSGDADLHAETKESTHVHIPQHHLTESYALPDLPLEIGDHVYQWRSFAGIPGVFQHHGIVMDVGLDHDGNMELQIADFSCILRTPSNDHPSTDCPEISQTQSIDMLTGFGAASKRRSSLQPLGVLRVYNSSPKDPKWYKVHYRANVWKTTLWRSGTCTCVESDPPAKVLARAYFLLEHPEVLPSYHIFRSNCECVSLWCKTGVWSTLQASSLLSLAAAGQLKSTATLAAYAASTQVTVQAPAAGIWGYLGYTTTTQVSLLSTQPHLITLLAAYGVVTAGGPTFVLWRAKAFWDQTTIRLEERFWAHAMQDPETFARSMVHWSQKHKAFER